MLLAAGEPMPLGSSTPRLMFGEEKRPAGDGVGRRVLFLDEQPAFELSFWCGTCQFLFRRLEGANDTLSIAELRDRLSAGLDGLDEEVINRFAALLPRGSYLPLLLSVTPRLIHPVREGDYFAVEQVATWGVDSFWGLPEYPHTAYYRTFDTPVDADAHLHEFVVPMVPPGWNDQATVDDYAEKLATSATPTAIAVSTLDVCQPAMDTASTDHYAHWGLTHFLLDGHHKMHAAAGSGRPIQLLSLLPGRQPRDSRPGRRHPTAALSAGNAKTPSLRTAPPPSDRHFPIGWVHPARRAGRPKSALHHRNVTEAPTASTR